MDICGVPQGMTNDTGYITSDVGSNEICQWPITVGEEADSIRFRFRGSHVNQIFNVKAGYM